LVDLVEIQRSSGFVYLRQAQRELEHRTVPTDEITTDLAYFQLDWKSGASPQQLGAKFHFQKVHDAECVRRGIVLYEIYLHRGAYRGVVAWLDSSGPGYWVSFFKKQGNPQSKASLRTAGERAVSLWRQMYEK
jgi:hypothetical protein